jgi:hypothetical protein
MKMLLVSLAVSLAVLVVAVVASRAMAMTHHDPGVEVAV